MQTIVLNLNGAQVSITGARLMELARQYEGCDLDVDARNAVIVIADEAAAPATPAGPATDRQDA